MAIFQIYWDKAIGLANELDGGWGQLDSYSKLQARSTSGVEFLELILG